MSLDLSFVSSPQITLAGKGVASTSASGEFVRSRNVWSPRLNLCNHSITGGGFGPSGDHGARNGNYIILPEDSGGFCHRSTDGGLTYTTIYYSDSSARSVCHIGGGVFVAVVYNRARVEVSSNNGLTWAATAIAFTGGVVDFLNGYLLLVGLAASTAALSSTNGTTWNSVTLPFAANRCLNIGGQMVIWNIASTSIGIATAADFSTWNTYTAPANPQFIAYGRGVWVIACSDNKIYQSADLINWTVNPTAVITATGLVYAPEYEMFLLSGSGWAFWGPDGMNFVGESQAPGNRIAILIPMSGGGVPYFTQNGSTYGLWTIEAPVPRVVTE